MTPEQRIAHLEDDLARERQRSASLVSAGERMGNVLYNLGQDAGPGHALEPQYRAACLSALRAWDEVRR